VAMLVAGLLLNERLNINILWGAIVTLVGVFLVNYSMKKSQKEMSIIEPEQ
jgi:drug/metabolite transporter (DMT)-like permease